MAIDSSRTSWIERIKGGLIKDHLRGSFALRIFSVTDTDIFLGVDSK